MAVTSMRIPAPAKINLFLRILRQRADRYHDLQTLFQFIDLCDWLSFEPNHHNQIICSYHNTVITPENDLILKAARLIQAFAPNPCGITIHLEKNIPMGGGLGGGSSDAASTLLALNYIWQTNLSLAQLLKLAQQLGADVPIFILGASSWAEGTGNNFTQLSPKEETLGLIYPDISINTAQIFNSEFLARNNAALSLDIHQIEKYIGINDCSSAIFKHYPIMQTYIATLAKHDIHAHVTGTGACLFFKYEKHQENQITQLCQQFNWQFWPIHSCNISPLKLHSPYLFENLQ